MDHNSHTFCYVYIFVAPSFAVFSGAEAFNSDVKKWDLSKITAMGSMFVGAQSFTSIWCSNDWASKISVADFTNSGGKVVCCPTGKFYNLSASAEDSDCELCPIGQYNNKTHVTAQLPLSCEICPRNTFAPIEGLPDCSDCEENQYR